MELGIRHLCCDNGVMTMIVPYPLSNQMYAEKLRKMFTHDYNMYQIVDLNGTKIFENATVSNCIPFVLKSQTQSDIQIAHIDERHIHIAFTQPLAQLIQDPKTEVWNLTHEQRQNGRHSDMHILGDFCYISKGMVLNADEKTAKGEFSKEDLISLTQDEIHSRKYIEAKDIDRYQVKRVRYLEWDTSRCPNQLSRPTFRELYEREKFIVNSIGKMLSIIDDGQNYLHNHSISCGVRWCDLHGVKNKSISGVVKRYSTCTRTDMEELSKNYSIKFFVGLLNSRYARKLIDDIRGGGLSIYPDHIRNLPIPLVSAEQQASIIALVDTILLKKQQNPGADTAAEESAIDKLVYQLYGLTEDEIKMVEA